MFKGLFKNFEKIMTAATFAEAGEHETARKIIRETDQPHKRITKRPRVYTAPNAQR